MKVLDLFSGIGGFSLGLERAGMETVAFCEMDKFCQQVLAKHWPNVPIFPDIKELDGNAIGLVDLICGGYPCQPFSTAGKRGGKEDDRHLWLEMYRLVATLRPRWMLAENVAGHISMGLDQVLSDLEGEGYTCWPLVIPACAVDAQHRRDRVWIVAHDGSLRRDTWRTQQPLQGLGHKAKHRQGGSLHSGNQLPPCPGGTSGGICEERARPSIAVECGGEDVSDANSPGRQQQRRAKPSGQEHAAAECDSRWSPEPPVGRVANGVPRRVDRLRSLGNAVVPQVVEMLGRVIMEADGTP